MTCLTGKRIYDTRAQARAMRKRYPGAARRAYPCDRCGGWHLGRLTRSTKQGANRTAAVT